MDPRVQGAGHGTGVRPMGRRRGATQRSGVADGRASKAVEEDGVVDSGGSKAAAAGAGGQKGKAKSGLESEFKMEVLWAHGWYFSDQAPHSAALLRVFAAQSSNVLFRQGIPALRSNYTTKSWSGRLLCVYRYRR